MDTHDSCKATDSRPKVYKFSNNYITMETSDIDPSVYFYLHLNTGQGDKQRPMIITVENVTCENIVSFTDVLKIGTYGPYIALKNIWFRNVSHTSVFVYGVNITTTNEVYIYSNTHFFILQSPILDFTFKDSTT